MIEDCGAKVNIWINVVRRSRLHVTTKLIAFLMASYASPDGTNIYPGVALLAIQSGYSYSTVQREMRRLRDVGLIEAMPRTGIRRSWSTPYRLIIAADLLEKIDVPSPATERAAVDNLAARYRGKHRQAKSARHPDGVQIDDCTSPDDTTARHGHLAEQGNQHRTLHVPPPGLNPTSDEAGVRDLGTGSTRASSNGKHDLNGSEDDRRQALDKLATWIAEHPESVTR